MNVNELAAQYPAWYWWTTAILCIVLPPVGIFLLGWLGVGAVMKVQPDYDPDDSDDSLICTGELSTTHDLDDPGTFTIEEEEGGDDP